MRLSGNPATLLLVVVATLPLFGCSQAPNTITYSPSPTDTQMAVTTTAEVVGTEDSAPSFPKTVELGTRSVIIHPPQVTSWKDFETIEGIAAVETVPTDSEPARFGVVSFTADAIPDLDARTVHIENVRVTSFSEGDEELPLATRELFESTFQQTRVIPLDLALSHLADDVITHSSPNVISEPPTLFISNSSAVLVLLHGEPVLAPIERLGLQFAANTNWSLFYDESDRLWFLRNDDTWLQAPDYTGPWTWAGDLSFALRNLPQGDNWRSTRSAATQWDGAPSFDPPTVFVSTTPAELILIVGEPSLVNIGNGLSYVSNTDSQLFMIDDSWYYLVSGRWFRSTSLDGQWQSIVELPEAFASIPADHVMANVLASVPGTLEAKIAALDAQIPKKTTLTLDTQLPETVSYTGEPEFVEIAETNLKRASNTSYDVIQVDDEYYLCFNGTWYKSDSARGPWSIATSIPAEIYTIPASDPAHHITYVTIYETTPTTVTYSYNASYYHVYFYYGMPVYGTGWYYPPYAYYYGGYPYYYSYPYTYGSGSFYNPRTGAYGSVSRAYGPYGGWGYASGYNPNTGTYARAEAVWDYDEWYAVGEAYNPRSGNYFATERYYDADDGDWKINSTLQTQRGDIDISRRFDDDEGRLDIRTGAGGEGTFTRHASDGGWDTNGQFTTADGRTITSSGRFENGRGTANFVGSDGGTGSIDRSGGINAANRQGTFTRDGQTLTTNTNRDGLNTRTSFETSAGAQGVVAGRGLDTRTGIGQSASGDVYATRDGNVYRRTDDGWQQRSGDSWSNIDSSRTNTSNANRSTARDRTLGTQQRQSVTNRTQQRQSISNRTQSLNRQSQARRQGMSRSTQFQRQRNFGGGVRRRR